MLGAGGWITAFADSDWSVAAGDADGAAGFVEFAVVIAAAVTGATFGCPAAAGVGKGAGMTLWPAMGLAEAALVRAELIVAAGRGML